jgi:hypothetical protein
MAQRVVINMSGNVAQVEHFTMNNSDIGENRTNRNKADVELIQFFLWEFYSRNGHLFSLLPRVSRTPGIEIDGICGRQTKSGIYNFQKHHRLLGNPIRTDGVVDVTKNLHTSGNPAIYTIWWLNKWFFANGTGTISEKEDLRTHPVVARRARHLIAELNRMPTRTVS